VHPFVFLACTYNLWGSHRWDERREPLRRFLELNRPDVLCAQELTADSSALITDTIPSMRCVEDSFPGWTEEGNVFWNADHFDLVEFGAEDIGQLAENQRLFWVRLAVESGATVVIATAHFTWTGNIREITEQINVRVGEAEASAACLDALVGPDEPVLFMGDFNDYIHPIRMLRIAGFDDSFMALGLEPVITYPAFPIPHQPPELLDWMMHRGPIRPTLTSVVDFYDQGFPPSDHKPVLTTYKLDQGE